MPADERATTTWTADEAVTHLFASQYRPLVRLAVLLVHDNGVAEELVQDIFVALHQRWGRLRDPDKAVAYLRQSVVNRARSVLRHRAVVDRYLRRQGPPATAPSADVGVLDAETTRRGAGRGAHVCRPGSGRRWCCATTATCPRRRSRRPWA